MPDGGAPAIIINSVDNKSLVDWFTAGKLGEITEFLVREIGRLEGAGADFGLIAANTPHLVFDEVQKRVRLPLLSIVKATADAASSAGLKRLALFGTRFTMQSQMFPATFSARGLTIVTPGPAEQEFIHGKYMGELFIGEIRQETHAALLRIVEALKERDRIDALVLGGTELSLIIREPTAAGLPVLDTTQIHVGAALDWMLSE